MFSLWFAPRFSTCKAKQCLTDQSGIYTFDSSKLERCWQKSDQKFSRVTPLLIQLKISRLHLGSHLQGFKRSSTGKQRRPCISENPQQCPEAMRPQDEAPFRVYTKLCRQYHAQEGEENRSSCSWDEIFFTVPPNTGLSDAEVNMLRSKFGHIGSSFGCFSTSERWISKTVCR